MGPWRAYSNVTFFTPNIADLQIIYQANMMVLQSPRCYFKPCKLAVSVEVKMDSLFPNNWWMVY